MDTDVDNETNEQIWGVRYDDGEQSDYNAAELHKILCTDETNVFE